MHACPECGMACDCDGEDLWHDWPFNLDCTHECEDEDDEPYLDDDAWSCECHICPECGEMPRDCSNTEPFAHGERASFHQLDIALDALTRIMTKAAELDDQTIARIVRRAIVTIQGER